MEKLFTLTDERLVKQVTTTSVDHEFSRSNVSYHLVSDYAKALRETLKTAGSHTESYFDSQYWGESITEEYHVIDCEVYKNSEGTLFVPIESLQ